MTLKESAIFYAKLGIAVIPLKPRDKYPLLKNWQNLATSNVKQVESWWNQNPNYNIGMVTGAKSRGVVVVDLDEHPEENKFGLEIAKDWQNEHGNFPETWESVTGSGGKHIFFRTDNNPSRSQHLYHSSVDFQAGEALIVLPPSIHPNGNEYFWDLSPEDYPIANIDENVWNFIKAGEKEQDGTTPIPSDNASDCGNEKINEGHRVKSLFKLLSTLKSLGISDDQIKDTIKKENLSKCNPPLTDEQLEKEVFPSIKRYDQNDATAYYHPFKLPDKMERQNRINYLYKLVFSMKSKNISDKAIISTIKIENQEKCNPPLSDEDINNKVLNALNKYKGGRMIERRREVVRLSEISSLE